MTADFAIFEEGRRQAISHFASRNALIDLGLLLEYQRHAGHLGLGQKAVHGLPQRLRDGDRAVVAAIGSSVSLHQPMTPDLVHVDEAQI